MEVLFATRNRLLMWAKKARITGVRVSPYSFRFTFIRHWIKSDGHSLILQRILKHTSPVMMAYYATYSQVTYKLRTDDIAYVKFPYRKRFGITLDENGNAVIEWFSSDGRKLKQLSSG